MSSAIEDGKLKLAVLGTRGIPAKYGGFETFAEELSTRLVRAGFEVTVYCEKEGAAQPVIHKGILLEYVRAPSLGPLKTIIFDLLCLWRARKSYDVVYMLGYGTSMFCFLPRIFGGTVWINMDGIEWRRAKWSWIGKLWLRWMERAAVITASRLIADAEGIREHLRGRYRKLPPCSVIAYGAEVISESPAVSIIDEWQVHPREYYLVVCRLEPENHVDEIVRGYVRTGSRNPLVIVGDNTIRTDYVRSLLSVKDDRVRFVGTIYDRPKLNALRYYSRAYFHGHAVGGTNPSLLEAMGAGNTIAAHDNRFNREVLGDGGLFFLSADEAGEAVAMLDKLSERELIERGERNRRRVAKRYSWDGIARQYVTLLEDACSS